MRKTLFDLITDLSLFSGGSIMVFSGLSIQAAYHMEGLPPAERVLGMVYSNWSDIHIFSSVSVAVIMIFHIIQHWKWYKIVVKKRLFSKNQQVLMLTLIFLIVAIIGLIPWMIDINHGDQNLRKAIIEVHDKIAIVLFIYLILHVVKRFKWYLIAFKRLQKS